MDRSPKKKVKKERLDDGYEHEGHRRDREKRKKQKKVKKERADPDEHSVRHRKSDKKLKIKQEKPDYRPSGDVYDFDDTPPPTQEEHRHRHHHKSHKKVKKEKAEPPALSSPKKLAPIDSLDILGSLDELGYDQPQSSLRMNLGKRKAVDQPATRGPPEPLDPLLGFRSRKQRTAVFAGTRTGTVTSVSSLEQMCLRVLMDHVDKITYVGAAPYYLLKPVLVKCTAAQLQRFEMYNEQLLDETDELWKEHCQAEFRNQEPDESDSESWRELYQRATAERDNRLRKITSSIKKTTEAREAPVRKTVKMDSFAAGKMRNGRAQYPVPSTSGNANCVGVVRATSASVKDSIHKVRMATQGNANKKPNKAPLMAKSIQMFKSRFRR